jgi:hypothetical protein
MDEVMNAGRMDVIDQIYSPALAPCVHRWIAPFRASFPDVHMTIVDLIAERSPNPATAAASVAFADHQESTRHFLAQREHVGMCTSLSRGREEP